SAPRSALPAGDSGRGLARGDPPAPGVDAGALNRAASRGFGGTKRDARPLRGRASRRAVRVLRLSHHHMLASILMTCTSGRSVAAPRLPGIWLSVWAPKPSGVTAAGGGCTQKARAGRSAEFRAA